MFASVIFNLAQILTYKFVYVLTKPTFIAARRKKGNFRSDYYNTNLGLFTADSDKN